MDEQEKNTVSFDNYYEEPVTINTVEIEPPAPEPVVFTEPVFTADQGGSGAQPSSPEPVIFAEPAYTADQGGSGAQPSAPEPVIFAEPAYTADQGGSGAQPSTPEPIVFAEPAYTADQGGSGAQPSSPEPVVFAEPVLTADQGGSGAQPSSPEPVVFTDPFYTANQSGSGAQPSTPEPVVFAEPAYTADQGGSGAQPSTPVGGSTAGQPNPVGGSTAGQPYPGSGSNAGQPLAGGGGSNTVPPAYKRPTPPPKKKKEKKYVSVGALIACMLITMLLSSLLSAFIASKRPISQSGSTARTEREDEELSHLNLSDATGSEHTVAEIVGMNADAVVEIVVSGTTQNIWGQLELSQGAGSGVIVRDDGYIATNYHVIQGANKVEVTLHNGDTYSARIIGSDPENDIAVIKIDATELTTATIGDSSKVEVGDLAVAIGNPLGQLGGTATTGIISALDRTLTVEGTTLTLIQTDAAINGGNSGGGLFNSKGELIGIVESKASAVGVEGLAFALPINTVAPIINELIDSGGKSQPSKSTPAVGIVISDVSEENAQYYGLESAGVYIADVTGENAKKAGFQAEDRIVSFNGTEITNSNDFITLVRKCKVGDNVTIVVSRKGQQIEIKTVLEELQTVE